MDRYKKITLFMPSFAGGGAERVMLHLAKGFADRDYDINLVVTSNRGALTKYIPENIDVVNLKSLRIITSIWPFAKYLKEAQPDIILSALKSTNVVALISHNLVRSKAKIFVSEHSNFSGAQKSSSKIRDRMFPLLLKMLYPKADGIIAVSEGVKKDLEEQLAFSSNITTIYNPIVSSDLKQKSKQEVTHYWFNEPNLKVVIGVGRFIKAKNFPLLIKAFKSIYEKNKNTRLVILGEGPERSDLENLVKKTELRELVWMPGFINNPYKYMAKASCFVLSSNWEGFGNVIVEAMACGTRVVSTDCPSGPREILEDGKWGNLVELNNERQLANAVLDSLEQPVDNISARAQFFSVRKSIDGYLQELKI